MNRINLIILILLGFVLVVPFGNGISAQSSNPFELISVKDSSFLDSIVEVIEIQDSSFMDSISEVVNFDAEAIVPAPLNIEQEPILNQIVEKNEQNPFELTSGKSLEPIQENSVLDTSDVNQSISLDSSLVSNSPKNSFHTDSILTANNDKLIEIGSERKAFPIKGKNLIIFLITLFCGLLLSVAINSNRNIIGKIGKSLQNLSYMKLLQKEERNGLSGGFIILHIIYILNAAIFVWFACIYFDIPIMGLNLYGILLLITGFLLLRHLSLFVISYLRKRLPDAINYSFIITTINLILGLILIPINLLIAYGPEFIVDKTIIFGLVIVALSFLIRWFRGFLNSLRIIIGDSFHFLLYLCTCEIVPVMIIIGYVRSLIN